MSNNTLLESTATGTRKRGDDEMGDGMVEGVSSLTPKNNWLLIFMLVLATANKPPAEESSSQADNNLPAESGNHQMVESMDETNNMEDNSSSSPTENSSSDDSRLLDSICNDESLLNSLWIDEPPLIDASWNNIQPGGQNISDMSLPSWEDNSCAWLLDCHDFGIHDFGFDCLMSDIELNTLNTLEMGDKQ
ncbi:hypothetical protein JRO89_XS13G0050400 [Xanthoceras sorbifolium]|uniref:Uncharacterized protein n=1 Tax=Xanthoceras sorbifolium TaxID=99658 RepID=A0ABQ8H6M9_9ROSI|nr:hypothetical protein JRO89_XS13G0050400 [Xanthoceras sorbifolium]